MIHVTDPDAVLALPDLQEAFGAALLGEDAPALVAAVLADGLPPDARLRIYRHHVFTTLTGVLEGTYPVVRRLVGAGFFAYAADRFIRAYPPQGPCLFEYGGAFAAFLAGFAPCAHLRYLPDVARLEWALEAARHAEDASPVAPQALAAVASEAMPDLVFRLDPSFAYLASPWPVDRIWRANQPDAEPGAVVDLDAGGVTLEVRRTGDEVVFRPLDPATHAFRAALAGSRSLADAAGAALEADEGFDLVRAIADLITEGAVVGLVAPPSTETPS
jgi:hypothetical protein